jgi:hypothetical protein
MILSSFIVTSSLFQSKRIISKLSMKASTSMSVEDLLLHVKSLSPVNQRAIAAVVGSAVGDAATRPMHWVYDRTKLEGTLRVGVGVRVRVCGE